MGKYLRMGLKVTRSGTHKIIDARQDFSLAIESISQLKISMEKRIVEEDHLSTTAKI